MTKTREPRDGKPRAVGDSESALNLLASSRDSARALWDAAQQPGAVPLASAVMELRRAVGYSLPFAPKGPVPQTRDHFFVPTTRLMRCQLAIEKLDVGNSYINAILRLPEGRHRLGLSRLREIESCVDALGWSVDSDRLLPLVYGLGEPTNSREAVLSGMMEVMLNVTVHPLTADSLIDLYNGLFDRGDAPRILDVSEAERRCRAILENLCAALDDAGPLSAFPLVQALAAHQAITILKPFPALNSFMASLAFSRKLIASGFIVAGFVPVTAILSSWDDEGPIERPAEYLIHQAGRCDWTLWMEEVLARCAQSVADSADELFGLFLQRKSLGAFLARDQTLNARQQEVLLEAILHDDAEFTFSNLMDSYRVGYATAYADLSQLKEAGYLTSRSFGKTTVFSATPDLEKRVKERLSAVGGKDWAEHYDEFGNPTPFHREAMAAALEKLRASAPLDNQYFGFVPPVYDRARRIPPLP